MKLPYWRLLLPLLFQIAIPLSMATEPLAIVLTGTTVYLQTQPVDPYDFLRGYSQVVSYEFSDLDYLRSLPGGKTIGDNPREVYVVLAAPQSSSPTNPTPWQPVRVSTTFPNYLSEGEIAMKGRVTSWRNVDYGINEFYFPEAQQQQINQAVRESMQERTAIAEVKVGKSGKAILQGLWLQGKQYKF